MPPAAEDPRAALVAALEAHSPADAEEARDREQIVAFVQRHERPFDRAIREGHLTGSAVTVSADGERVLLLHHRKLGRWLQPLPGDRPGRRGTRARRGRAPRAALGPWDETEALDPNHGLRRALGKARAICTAGGPGGAAVERPPDDQSPARAVLLSGTSSVSPC